MAANRRGHRQREQASKTGWPRRGEIYLTALDPALGREIQKTRPALIIQNDVRNRVTDLTIVAPITSTVRLPLNPVQVLLQSRASTGLSTTSVALLSQIRAIDRMRLLRYLGSVDAETMSEVDEAIQISLGLIPL
jgi:mRNA interferase MazF